MEMTTFLNTGRANNRRDGRNNRSSSLENRHILQINVARGRASFDTSAANETHRNSQDDTDWLHRFIK